MISSRLGNCIIINDDMANIVKTMKSDSIDLVLTDPPYGVRSKEEWDNKDNFIKTVNFWLRECLRVSKHTVIWFCAGKMLPYILKAVNEDLLHRLLVWNKPPGTQLAGASHNHIWYSIEPILIFSKDEKETVKFGELTEYIFGALDYRTVPFSEFEHPTSKPEGLVRDLILHYSNLNSLIFDPFAGSATTAVVALDTDRRVVTIEKDVTHYATGVKRIKEYLSQPKLFTETFLEKEKNEPLPTLFENN